MAVCVRRFSTLTAVLTMAAVLVPAGTAGSRDSAPAALPTLYVKYTMNCTFTIVDDSGKTVTSIAPGTYQVYVSTPIMFKLVDTQYLAANDFTGCKGWVQFQLTGPGVNLSTTLDAGCDAYYLLPAASFQPNATYTAQDLNQPSVTHSTFTTLASGSPVIPPSPYTPTSGKGTASSDLVGSGIKAPVRGTLTAALSPNGTATLMRKGKTISTLKAGRYTFAITDRDPKGGFSIQALKGLSKSLTGVRFVGKHSVTVTLKVGRWMYSGPGKVSYFVVTS